MTKYRVIKAEEIGTEKDEESVIEIRFVMDQYNSPTIEGRNPGGEWVAILFFADSGRVGLLDISPIRGLKVDENNYVVVY